MKKALVLFTAVLFTALLSAGASAGDFDHGKTYFVPKIGYLDPRAQGTKADVSFGGEVLYEWGGIHGLDLGFIYSKHDITDQSQRAKSRILQAGYRRSFQPIGVNRGNFYVGADLASHRVTFQGAKFQKIGGALTLGFEFPDRAVVEIGYLFAGSDEDVRLGGLGISLGYRL